MRDSPNSALAHALRFMHLWREGLSSDAEGHARTALKIYPDYFDAWDSYGDFLQSQGRPQEAARAYDQAADKASRAPFETTQTEAGYFHLKAAGVYLNLGKCQQAQSSLTGASQHLDPSDLSLVHFRTAYESSECANEY